MNTQNAKNLKSLFVTKRSGEKVLFHLYKIEFVLKKLDLTSFEQAKIINILLTNLENMSGVTTKEIANILTMALAQIDVNIANSYTTYFHTSQANFADATNIQKRIEKLFAKDAHVVHENANKDSRVFNTQRDLQAGAASRALGLKMLPPLVAKAHLRGDLHWHDLDYSPVTPATNCCLIDFDNLLKNGYKIGNAWVDSPKSIQTATAQMAQIIANVASLQYGGCSANRIDQLLAPYAQLNYEKHLADAKEWVTPNKQSIYAKTN